MTESKEKFLRSPEICAWADDENDNYHIEVTLPGVEKDSIKLKMHEDSFFISGETDNTIYVGSYSICCPVKAVESKANYKNGVLKIDVPFKDPMEDAIEIKIE
ncbi:MAG: Hsp20/alpha crystallin family protein [Candidatus Thorarchaeota archaeon]